MDLGEPLVLPIMPVPEPIQIPTPILEVPRADIPSYKPLVVPPSDLRPPPGVNTPEEVEEEATAPPRAPIAPITLPPIPTPEVTQIEIPVADIKLPIPQPAVLATAATTATVSVAATLTATAMFKRLVSLMKPFIRKILTKNAKN
jgi:hypothetical protein